MTKKPRGRAPVPSDFLFYAAPDGAVKVQVLFRDETAWLPQKALAELFGVKVPAINKHLKNIYESGELERGATISKMETVRSEGARAVTREVEFYNLDAIIAVGYRVNSYQATQFRIWATKTLREFLIKGFVLDDERLEQGKTVFGKDYFDDLLERIREIRASERRFYQKVTDIYALSIDYDPNAPLTREFFANVQNTLHWAITGQTAAELIYDSADATKLFMGLTTWKHAPHGKILRSDVSVAKNYLSEAHVRELNRLVSAYLDLAETRAERGILMKMKDWASFLEQFLALSSYPILADKGRVSALEAKLKAEAEFEVYRKKQDAEYLSDFDRVVEETKRLQGSDAPTALPPEKKGPSGAPVPEAMSTRGKPKAPRAPTKAPSSERRGDVDEAFQNIVELVEAAQLALGRGSTPVERKRGARSASSKRQHEAEQDEIELGKPLDLVVLARKSNALRCRLLGTERELTLRTAVRDEVPGEIVTVVPAKSWTHARHPYLSGSVEASRLDIQALGLRPLELRSEGDWDPSAEYWGEDDEPIEECLKPIIARGKRPAFEMEQVIPGADPEDFDSDPILEASDLLAVGHHAEARELLMSLLAADLRCLDAHSHLGNWALEYLPRQALRHYAAAVGIGALTLGSDFDGVLPWGLIDNRPFLRCMHGLGLSFWKLGYMREAAGVFRRMLWLNPSDNQGARFNLAAVEDGRTWEELEDAET